MSNLLILGSEGFLGKKIYKIFKNKYNIYTLDLLNSKKTNHIKKDIEKFNLTQFIYNNKVKIIIDLIGCSNHNFLKKKDIEKSFNKNYKNKINIILNLEKTKTEINYFSIGSLYKFGDKKKIRKKIYFPINKSEDLQLKFKYQFEKKLYNIKNNNVKVQIINIGSVFNNRRIKKIGEMNLIDQIALSIKKKQNKTIYLTKKIRYKNCINIDDLSKLISPLIKKIKFKYSEINIVNNLINFSNFTKKLENNYETINITLVPKKFSYYFIKKPIIYKNFFKDFKQIYFK